MGSKRVMLQNGLGDLISREVDGAARFVDLFAGSSVVACHVAMKYKVPVAAFDLQTFSMVLARAVLGRKRSISPELFWQNWYKRARKLRQSVRPPLGREITQETVKLHRQWCAVKRWPMTKSYGGYYFSSLQAVWLDALRRTLPKREPERTVALAALICTASKCAAAPGHTAQPFQPTRTAKLFLAEAWNKSIVDLCKDVFFVISDQHAKVLGAAAVADANEAAKSITNEDLVFIDPPYSGVHYSRFYHVLETLARGHCSNVSGAGRYPMPRERPWSKYSVQSESAAALDELFETISSRGAKVIVTFPLRKCSNGLSGSTVIKLAGKHFKIKQHFVASKFSTLGGNNEHRNARRSTRELILLLTPPNDSQDR